MLPFSFNLPKQSAKKHSKCALVYQKLRPPQRYLNMEMVTAAIRRFTRKHEERLHQHVNVEALQLLDNSALVRRLKRTKPFELV
jgi:thiazole synthase ThiGH ThiG subunit